MFDKISYHTGNIIKYSGLAVAFAIVSFGIVYFFSKQMSQISNGIYDYNNIYARKQERIAVGSRLEVEINKISAENVARLQNALVVDEDISDIVRIIDNLAGKYSSNHSIINVSGITPSTQGSGTNTFVMLSADYSFQMTAGIDSVLKYLKELEANPNFISTVSIRISSSDTRTGWNGGANVSLTGKIYYKKTN